MSADPAAAHAAARAAALYLMSASAVAAAQVAWPAAGRAGPFVPAAWSALVAAALILGEAAAPGLGDLQRTWRARGRLVLTLGYSIAASIAALVAAGAPEPGVLARVTALASVLQVATVGLAGAMEERSLAIVNAYLLLALAAIRGGRPAVVAALCVPLAHALVLAHDRAVRALVAFHARRGPGVPEVARQWALAVAAPGLALAAWLAALPPRPYAGIRWDEGLGREGPPEGAWRLFLVAAFVGTTAIYIAASLVRRRGKKAPPIEEIIDAPVVDDEPLGDEAAPPPSAEAGARGRVVQAYLVFLRRAARLGYPRRPEWTPREFAAVLRGPAEALETLTRAFMDARYGERALGERDAVMAESAAETILASLETRRRPRSG